MKTKYISTTEETLTNLGLQKSSAKLLPVGAVIVSTRATIGESAITKTELCTNQGFKSIICDQNKVLPEYLYYYFKSIRHILESKSKSTTYAEINKTNLESIEVPVPPISIQVKIIKKLEEIISRVEKRKEKLFSIRRRINKEIQILPNQYKKYEIDKLIPLENYPKHWKIMKLKDVCNKITDGAHKTPTYVNEGIPFLRVKDIHENEINWHETRKIPESEHLELTKRCKPEFGDVLFSKNGTIGLSKVVHWKNEFSIFVSLALLKPKKELLDSYFLKYFLDSTQAIDQIIKRSKTATVTNLHLEEIREIDIPLPPLEEQVALVKIIREKIRNIEEIQVRLNSMLKLDSKFEKEFDNIILGILKVAFVGKLID